VVGRGILAVVASSACGDGGGGGGDCGVELVLLLTAVYQLT
jgi:hypothetical protein